MLTPDLNEIKDQFILEKVHVTSLSFLAVYVGVRYDGNQEIHQNDQQKNNIYD